MIETLVSSEMKLYRKLRENYSQVMWKRKRKCNELLTELQKEKQLQQQGQKEPASKSFGRHDEQVPREITL